MSSAPKPIAAQKKPVTIYKEGYIWKKCPTGIKGFRKWQKRWFVITDKAILYYKKQGDTEPLGVIPLMQIVDAEYLPEKRVGCRFDVRVKNLRVYSLHGSGVDDAKIWTHAINEAMIRAKSTDDTFGPSKKSDTTVKLTKLQVLFARARGGFDASKHGSKEEQKAQMTLKMQFPTDGDLLKHFLHVILEPKTGVFDFDMADEKDEKVDVEDEVKEQKKDEFGNPIVNPEAEKALATPVVKTDKCKLEICNATIEGKTDFCIFHQGRSLPKPEQHTKGAGSISGPINPQMSAKEMKDKGLQVLPVVAQAAQNKGITEMFHSKEFIRYLCDVFNSPDKVAHGYAVRVMWSVFRGIYSQAEAAAQFAAYIDIHASAAKFNMEIKGALLTILLQTPAKVLQQTDKLTISFYMPVHNPTTWQALLHCLNNSDFSVRKSALEDINTILHDNFDNCRSLRRNKNWQSWVYSIVTDIPKSKNQDPVLKTVFAYCVNVVTLVHFQYYMKKAFFYGVMEESLHRLHQFGGSTSEGSRIASTMLAALCSKLGAQQKSFSQDKDSVEWRNLWQLTRVIRKFVFQTAYWQTGAGVTKDLAASAVVPQTEEKKEDTDQMGGPLRLGGISSPNTSNNQRIKVMKMERDKSAEFVLYKCRVGKAERTFTDDPELTDCGLHWNDDGRCGDVALVQKVAELFKQLHVHEFNAELNPTMSSKEKEFLLQCVKEFEFWEDCKQFVELVHKADIEERKLLSYRKMSFLVQNWLAANYSRNDRKAVIAEINGIIKDRAKADKKAATLKVDSRDSVAPNSAQATSLPPSSPMNRGASQNGGSFSAGNQGPLDMSSLPPHLREKQKQLGKQQSFHERSSAPPPPANDDD